jgi:hypothetical protein
MTAKPVPNPEDLAYLRGLAEEARNAPPLNGPILIAASLIFGAGSLGHWAIQSGLLAVDPMAILWVWLAAGAVFAVTLFVLIRRMTTKPGYNHIRNEAVGAAWSGAGFTIFSIWLGLMAMGLTTGDWTAMRIMPSLVCGAYGTGWLVAAAMSGRRWMNTVAIASYAGAAILGLVSHLSLVFLVYVAILICVALIPGIVLTRGEARGSV